MKGSFLCDSRRGYSFSLGYFFPILPLEENSYSSFKTQMSASPLLGSLPDFSRHRTLRAPQAHARTVCLFPMCSHGQRLCHGFRKLTGLAASNIGQMGRPSPCCSRGRLTPARSPTAGFICRVQDPFCRPLARPPPPFRQPSPVAGGPKHLDVLTRHWSGPVGVDASGRKVKTCIFS